MSQSEKESAKIELQGMMDVLGGKKEFHRSLLNRVDLIELSKIGVTKAALLHVAEYLELSLGQIADLLPITERTVQRYSDDQHFSPSVSEHILQIAECAVKGRGVFEDKQKFLNWLRLPNKALGYQAPLGLLGSRFGLELVLDELGRIEHGVFS